MLTCVLDRELLLSKMQFLENNCQALHHEGCERMDWRRKMEDGGDIPILWICPIAYQSLILCPS